VLIAQSGDHRGRGEHGGGEFLRGDWVGCLSVFFALENAIVSEQNATGATINSALDSTWSVVGNQRRPIGGFPLSRFAEYRM